MQVEGLSDSEVGWDCCRFFSKEAGSNSKPEGLIGPVKKLERREGWGADCLRRLGGCEEEEGCLYGEDFEAP